jgi:cyclopropane fatty-acyl-phospholipid synthase-like methyltransferase
MTAELPRSPASERNKDPILEQLRRLLPPAATVLEIASGFGQHVAHFAAALPGTTWQPTDTDPANLLTIAARCDGLSLHNVHAPVELDVHEAVWRVPDEFDAVVCINMIHIAPWSATAALFTGAQRALRADGPGLLVLYGPYREGGRHTTASNEDFDASLRARNPAWGVRDLESVTSLAEQHGFRRTRIERLPANNLLLAFAIA